MGRRVFVIGSSSTRRSSSRKQIDFRRPSRFEHSLLVNNRLVTGCEGSLTPKAFSARTRTAYI